MGGSLPQSQPTQRSVTELTASGQFLVAASGADPDFDDRQQSLALRVVGSTSTKLRRLSRGVKNGASDPTCDCQRRGARWRWWPPPRRTRQACKGTCAPCRPGRQVRQHTYRSDVANLARRGHAASRLPHHPAEVGVRVGWLHLPQRAAQSLPDLLQIAELTTDRAGGQARRRLSQHEARQQIGL